jgi:hypothetical protein
VYETSKFALPGLNKFNIDLSGIGKGVYFYTVRSGDKSVTNKMVVQ